MSEPAQPCPFCGQSYQEEDGNKGWTVVACGNCGAMGPYGKMWGEAVKAWNKRQAHPSLLAAVERYLELSSDCDYVDGEPDVCPGVARVGIPCHWCEMRAAVAKARARQGGVKT